MSAGMSTATRWLTVAGVASTTHRPSTSWSTPFCRYRTMTDRLVWTISMTSALELHAIAQGDGDGLGEGGRVRR